MHLGEATFHHCRSVDGTTLHVMRDCPQALNIWLHLVSSKIRDIFLDCNLVEWIELNMKVNLGTDSTLNWSAVWANTCHLLWMWRNKFTHDKDYIMPWEPWTIPIKETRDYKLLNQMQIIRQHTEKVTKLIGLIPHCPL